MDDAIRGRALVEESREAVVVLDDADRVVLASRRARQAIEGVREGEPLPPSALVEQARAEIGHITELIDEVLFLSELESGGRVVALGPTVVRPVLEEALDELADRAARAGVDLTFECDESVELAIRPRMLRVVARNLAENAIRYAGPGATFVLDVHADSDGAIALVARDDGIGVEEAELPRLFERFYRADRARASRGTGLGLAIVKHVVTHAGGTIEARGSRGRGLEVRCVFPVPT